MKEINVNTLYTIAHSSHWAPAGIWGWLWRTLAFLVSLLAFILLFCLSGENNGHVISVERNPEDAVSVQLVPHTGDIQILLSWESIDDLDLICVEPDGETISYKNRQSSTGGCLDVDMNVSEPLSCTPIENIYWPEGKAPKGHYDVYVSLYARRSDVSHISYKVVIKYGDKTETVEGSCVNEKDKIKVFSFDFE